MDFIIDAIVESPPTATPSGRSGAAWDIRCCCVLPYSKQAVLQNPSSAAIKRLRAMLTRSGKEAVLATKPAIVLADEPTGNLDSKTSDEVMALLKTSAMKYEQTLIVITHNEDIAQMGNRKLVIADGKVVEQ